MWAGPHYQTAFQLEGLNIIKIITDGLQSPLAVHQARVMRVRGRLHHPFSMREHHHYYMILGVGLLVYLMADGSLTPLDEHQARVMQIRGRLHYPPSMGEHHHY